MPPRAKSPARVSKSPAKAASKSPARAASKSPARAASKSPKPTRVSASPAKPRATPKAKAAKAAKEAEDTIQTQLDAKQKELDAARDAIGLLTCPLRTLKLFVEISVELLLQACRAVATSRVMLFFGYWVLLAYGATHALRPELYAPPLKAGLSGGSLYMPELCLYEAIWWLVLGILSSVGFGTGLHSGIMFLWPHTMSVVLKAQEYCGSTNFNAMYNHPFNLHCTTKNDGSLTFFNQLLLLWPSVILWGVGTAVGELPPYFVTRAARRAGKRATDFEEELNEAKLKTDLVSQLKVWTIDFTQKNGFLGVYLLASWPNAAFDMCGMACGWLDMPFWTFFGATAIGKGVTKVTIQAIVCINVFGKGLFNSLMGLFKTLPYGGEWLATKGLAGRKTVMYSFGLQERMNAASFFGPSGSVSKAALEARYCAIQDYCIGGDSTANQSKVIEKVARVFAHLDTDGDGALVASELAPAESKADGKFSLASLDPGSGAFFSVGNLWNGFIVSLVLFFLLSIVDQMAKSKQSDLDEKEMGETEARLRKAD